MSCSQRSLELEADIWGTATENTTQWVLVEYTKEWLPKMRIPELHLPSSFAKVLESVNKRDGWKVLYIRRPGSTGRHVYWWNLSSQACKVAPIDSEWTEDFEGDASWQYPQDIGLDAPQILVCTHGSRDRCCGVLGGMIFSQLKSQISQILPSAVWQVSHLGGHRFAPTALCLPLGVLLGRIEPDDCCDIAHAVLANNPKRLRTEIIRGDVRYSMMQQARRLWVSQQQGVLIEENGAQFTWNALDGQLYTTTQSKIELGQLSVSCGDEQKKPVFRWDFQTQ